MVKFPKAFSATETQRHSDTEKCFLQGISVSLCLCGKYKEWNFQHAFSISTSSAYHLLIQKVLNDVEDDRFVRLEILHNPEAGAGHVVVGWGDALLFQ